MIKQGLEWLHKSSVTVDGYSPDYLAAIPRAQARANLSMPEFYGDDEWQGYEVSFLQPSGCPTIAQLTFYLDAHSPSVVESKSLKLYLNSFNNEVFPDHAAVSRVIEKDLSHVIGTSVKIILTPIQAIQPIHALALEEWYSLDDLNPNCVPSLKEPDLTLLSHVAGEKVHEKLFTRLFRANCLVTNQPDWATVLIEYSGKPWDHERLLQYLISYRNIQAFHEKCIDKVFTDLQCILQPETLVVQGNFTRRGGIDISPIRSNHEEYQRHHGRDWRQ